MNNRCAIVLTACLLTLGLVEPAAAYIGPGAGLSVIGAVWGLIVAIVAALGFVLFWPLRRMMRRSKTDAQPETTLDAHARDGQVQGDHPGSAPRSV